MKNPELSGKKFFPAFLLLLFLVAGNASFAQPDSLVVDSLTTLIDANYPPYNQAAPGDTIFLSGGHREFLLMRNFRGDSLNPITFMNTDGVVIIDTDHYFGISAENCRFIRLTGTGSSDNFYGIQIKRVSQGGGIGIGKLSSDFELDHVSIKNVQQSAIVAKTDPNCLFNSTRDKFTQYNTIIHDNYIENSGNEGMYVGNTKYFGQTVNCNGTDTLLMPSLLNGVRIFGNILHYTGWDGIQVTSASANCSIYDNLIMFDSQAEQSAQMSGILLGGGSKCDCYNNYISDGKGNGIESHGLGGYRIFNNIIVNAGKTFLPDDSSKMRHGIFISDVSALPDSSFYLLFNDMVNPKSDGIRFSSIRSRNNLIASNVIINPGNFDYYENGHTSFKGQDAYVMIPDASADVSLKNNYFARTPDSAGFSPTNYTLQPGSPLIDAAFSDNRGVAFDFYHHERPYGIVSDIGAHEYNPAFLGFPENQTRSAKRITLFPNPVTDSFFIRFYSSETTSTILFMYDLQGKLIGRYNLEISGPGMQTKEVNVKNLPEGIYLIMLRTGGQNHSGRFTKVGRN
jgi:hypothetical protein